MDKKRLDYYKKKLQSRREELIKSIARTEEEGRTADDDPTVDLADKAANSYTKEFLFGQTNTDRTMLALIDEALNRIKASTYGTCIECEEELQQKRLEAVPWARHCVVCAEKHEQGLLSSGTATLRCAMFADSVSVDSLVSICNRTVRG
jgi:DnaK suppressor protein